MDVKKRNGSIVVFDASKISSAVLKAFKAADVNPGLFPDYIADQVTEEIIESGRDCISIEEIQDMVEHALADLAYGTPSVLKVLKRYILYRDRRTKDRESINKLSGIYSDLINISQNDINQGNANIDGKTPAGQMYIFGSEAAKDYALKYLISPKYVEAYETGFIHLHDLDYVPTRNWNCNHISLVDIFSKPYIYTNDSIMRTPKRIGSFAALAAIIIQSEQNEQYGGQSFADWDYAMAKGVDLTFKENFRKYYDIYKDLQFLEGLDTCFKDEILKIGNEDLIEYYPWVYNRALKDTIRETHEAMAAFVYNLNSMHSRAGNQIVFSSINYGTDTSPEGRIVISETLNAVNEGLGDGSTAIFPISVFKVKDDINFSQEDWELAKEHWQDALDGNLKYKTPNFDLFIKACKVSARRLFPNFLFLDTPFNKNENWSKEDPERYKWEIATMGCRTRVFSDINGEKTCLRRGNLAFDTLNLPMIALTAAKEEKGESARIGRFFELLDKYISMAHDQLKERYEWQCSAYAKQFPFIVKNATVMGTENIGHDDFCSAKIGEEVLKHGTLGIGYVGLAEALVALVGKHHGESQEAQKLGLKIVGRIRELCDEYTETEKLNYGCFASPAESYCGKALKKARKVFGIVPGVTDREYFTNSNHCPVYHSISAIDKIRLEAPYHELANSGNISYVELDGCAKDNVKAFASVVVAMHDNNIGYGSVNHAADRCNKCGYEGPIEYSCPKCGNDDENYITRIRRITGYLTGNVKTRWNAAKKAEEADRVKHA